MFNYFRNFMIAALLALGFVLLPMAAFGQWDKKEGKSRGYCKDYSSWNSDREDFRETREIILPAKDSLSIDGKRNGGISVVGSDRRDIVVRACVQAWGETAKGAEDAVAEIKIDTSPALAAYSPSENKNWSVSYYVEVPRQIGLELTTLNGGITIDGVEGNIRFEAVNGGIAIKDAGGDVKGTTKNGGVSISLAGQGWRGSGLDVETKNGGVSLRIPSGFGAEIEASTVNGGFSSNFEGLTIAKGKWTGGRASGTINGGGAKIRAVTTNGGVSIKEL